MCLSVCLFACLFARSFVCLFVCAFIDKHRNCILTCVEIGTFLCFFATFSVCLLVCLLYVGGKTLLILELMLGLVWPNSACNALNKYSVCFLCSMLSFSQAKPNPSEIGMRFS